MTKPDVEELDRRVREHLHTILTEVRALNDLHQRTGDHLETLTRRLHRHLNAGPKTETRLIGGLPRRVTTYRMRDEEDGGD